MYLRAEMYTGALHTRDAPRRINPASHIEMVIYRTVERCLTGAPSVENIG